MGGTKASKIFGDHQTAKTIYAGNISSGILDLIRSCTNYTNKLILNFYTLSPAYLRHLSRTDAAIESLLHCSSLDMPHYRTEALQYIWTSLTHHDLKTMAQDSFYGKTCILCYVLLPARIMCQTIILLGV